MSKEHTRRRIVSILGLGPKERGYTPTPYNLSEHRSKKTPLLQEALLELFKPTTKMQIFGTEAVFNKWIKKEGAPIHLGDQEFLSTNTFHFTQIPEGKKPEELESLFWDIVDSLVETPIKALGEENPPTEIILDVTHGFRVQPMIALAAASFVQSQWMRDEGADRPTLTVVYGAFEASEDGSAPIWDLSSFLYFSLWNEAFSAFQRFGRADDLQKLALNLQKQHNESLFEQSERPEFEEFKKGSWLKNLGSQAASFSDELFTSRTENLPQTVERLNTTLNNDHAVEWQEKNQFISRIVEDLSDQIMGLNAKEPYSPEGLKSMAAAAQLLLRYQQYSQAIILIAEALKVYAGLLVCPKGAPKKKIYKQGANALHEKRKVLSDESDAAARLVVARKLAADIIIPRNTLAHAGFSQSGNSTTKAATLINNGKVFVERFDALVSDIPAPGSLSDRSPNTPRVFLNLSNHPVVNWPAKQIESARKRFGEPTDLEGWQTNIDPNIPITKIIALADRYAEQVAKANCDAVFVSGEPALSTSLVTILQQMGISCYASTSERVKTEETQEDGSIKISQRYEFVQWREYPDVKRLIDES